SYPSSLAMGDVNGDGNLDLAVTNSGTYPDYPESSVSVLLGNGDGTFQPCTDYVVGVNPHAVTVGDVNGDGYPDLVVANSGSYPNYTDGSLSVLLGNGDGTFQPALTAPAGGRPVAAALGDFNGDGVLDLAVADYDSATVSVFRGHGDGSFQ